MAEITELTEDMLNFCHTYRNATDFLVKGLKFTMNEKDEHFLSQNTKLTISFDFLAGKGNVDLYRYVAKHDALPKEEPEDDVDPYNADGLGYGGLFQYMDCVTEVPLLYKDGKPPTFSEEVQYNILDTPADREESRVHNMDCVTEVPLLYKDGKPLAQGRYFNIIQQKVEKPLESEESGLYISLTHEFFQRITEQREKKKDIFQHRTYMRDLLGEQYYKHPVFQEIPLENSYLQHIQFKKNANWYEKECLDSILDRLDIEVYDFVQKYTQKPNSGIVSSFIYDILRKAGFYVYLQNASTPTLFFDGIVLQKNPLPTHHLFSIVFSA